MYAHYVVDNMDTTQLAKGVHSMNMKHSLATIRFADSLIINNTHYDKFSGQYVLGDIEDVDLYKLSSLIMSDDSDVAAEATSPNNPHYQTKMLPALLNYMRNTVDKDNLYSYTKEWSRGTAEYCEPFIQQLLESRLQEYNYDKLHGYRDAG